MAALSEEQLLPFALLEEPSSQETETQLLDDLLVHEVMRDSIQQFTNDRGARIRKIQASIDNILRQLEKGGVATHDSQTPDSRINGNNGPNQAVPFMMDRGDNTAPLTTTTDQYGPPVTTRITSSNMNGSAGLAKVPTSSMDGAEMQADGSLHPNGSTSSSVPLVGNTHEWLCGDVLPKKRTYSSHLGNDGQAFLPDSKSRRTTPSPRGYNFNGPLNGSHGPVDSPLLIDLTGEDDDDEPLERYGAENRRREEASRLQQEQALEDAYFAEQFPNGVENHNAASIPSRVPSQPGSYESNPTATSSSETSPPDLSLLSTHFQDEFHPGADAMELPTRVKSSMPGGWDFEDDLFGEDPAGPSNYELFGKKAGIWDPIPLGPLPSAIPSWSLDARDINPYLSPLTANAPAKPVRAEPLQATINRTNGYDFARGTDHRGNPLPQRTRNPEWSSPSGESGKHIKDLLANISTEDVTVPESDRDPTPVGLQGTLYPHQQIALKWMRGMEADKNKRGGFLADDMGLGKTISTLSLILSNPAHHAGSGRANKTTVIVAPVSLIKQWEREIQAKVKPDHALRVHNFHQRKVSYYILRTYDVVVTSYGMLRSERKMFDDHMRKVAAQRGVMKEDASPKDDPLRGDTSSLKISHLSKDEALLNKFDDASLKEQADLVQDALLNDELASLFPFMGPSSMFHRVILDESQHIKNGKAQVTKAVMSIKTRYRWCLSGTPFMNRVDELAPCIEFLRIKPYSNPSTFKQTFAVIDDERKGRYGKQNAMRRLQVLLKAIMLRRTKNSEIDGKPIIQLPPKTEVIDHVVFDNDENLFYRDLEREGRVMVSKYLNRASTGKQYTQILLRLLRLRQACCHPFLHAEDLEWVEAENAEDDHMSQIAKSLFSNVVTRINATEADGFQCPICFEHISNPRIIVPCGHHICSECLVRVTHTTAEDNQQQGVEGSSKGQCPTCRQVVDLKNTINYYIYQKVHQPERSEAEDYGNDSDGDNGETGSEDDEDTAPEEGDEDEVDRYGNLKDFIVIDDDDEDDYRPEAKQKSKTVKAHKKRKIKTGETRTDFRKLTHLRKQSRKNAEGRRRYLRYLEDIWIDSAKVTKCKDILAEIQKTGEKTIVFSQWTMLLDFVEVPVKYELKLGYRRYDGSMSSTQRDNAVREFMEDPDVKVMLISIKAGNAGLNLVCASQVVIMDPFWNPYVEMQGVDRAHRIGQTKPVTVHRLLVKDTVEDRIAQLQEEKREKIETALDENASMSISKLSAREVGFLFGLT